MNLPSALEQQLHIGFAADGLSLLMVGLLAWLCLCVAVHARHSIKQRPKIPGHPAGVGADANVARRRLYLLLGPLFLTSSAIMLASTWFTFLVFTELTTLIFALLIDLKSRRTAILYMLVQLGGAAILLIGIAGSHSLSFLCTMGPMGGPYAPFFMVGLGVKASFLGFHFWLPEVHGNAYAPVSALLSGFAVKIGVYGLIRLSSGPEPVLLAMGMSMALWGIFQSIQQRDTKWLLAYSTISQLGIIITAIGIGTPLALAAAIAHTATHALAKGLLFLVAGSMEALSGSRIMEELPNRPAMPVPVFAAFWLGALALIGFPGTMGFMSKGLVKDALLEGHNLGALLALAAANVGTAVALLKMGYYGFLKREEGAHQHGQPTHGRHGQRHRHAHHARHARHAHHGSHGRHSSHDRSSHGPVVEPRNGPVGLTTQPPTGPTQSRPRWWITLYPLPLSLLALGLFPHILIQALPCPAMGGCPPSYTPFGMFTSLAMLTVATGLTVLFLRPSQKSHPLHPTPSLFSLLERLFRRAMSLLAATRRWHSGRVRHHLMEILAAALLILWALGRFR